MSVKKELDIVQAVKIFFEGPKEVRIPHTQHNGTMAGVFDDPAKLIASVLSDAVQGQKRSIYWTLQRLDPSKCTVTNALHPHAIKTAKDQDILEYRWLLIDCDPVKHEDGEISATDAEKGASLDVALIVFSLFDRLEYSPVLVDSGNGYHVLVPLDIPNTNGANELVRDMLRALNAHFGTTSRNHLGFTSTLYPVTVDPDVFNPARITKIPGTVARKGVHSIDRPHRLALIEYAPQITKRMNRETFELLLGVLIKMLPGEKDSDFSSKSAPRPANDAYMQIVLGEAHQFLEQKGIRAREKPDGEDILLTHTCAAADQHNSGSSGPTEAALIIKCNGDMRFHCKHGSCPLDSHADGTVPIQKFMSFLDPNREFKWTLPPVEVIWSKASTTPEGQNIQKAVGETKAAQNPYFAKDPVDGGDSDYVLAAMDFLGSPLEDHEGWFARGSVHMIGGSSGAGKSRFMIPLLEAQSKGERVLGHASHKLTYVMLLADRGKRALARTLRSLKSEAAKQNSVALPLGIGMDAVRNIIHAIEARDVLPAVVFVEGADMLVRDPNSMPDVAAFVKGLDRLADHYYIAVICSVGSRKLMQKEAFAAKRDSLFGSTAWARAGETVVIVEGSDPNIERTVFVMSRNGKAEKFLMEFVKGRFVEREEQPEAEKELPAAAFSKSQQGYWTAKDYQEAAGCSKTAAYRHICEAKAEGKIKERPGKGVGYATFYTYAGGTVPRNAEG